MFLRESLCMLRSQSGLGQLSKREVMMESLLRVAVPETVKMDDELDVG